MELCILVYCALSTCNGAEPLLYCALYSGDLHGAELLFSVFLLGCCFLYFGCARVVCMNNLKEQAKRLFRITGIPVLIASMCCLSPLIFLALGVITLGEATALADSFYGQYAWAFRLVGLALLALALGWHFWRGGVCSLSAAKRNRTRIINTILLALVVSVAAYLFFLYVVVHYVGVFAGVWE